MCSQTDWVLLSNRGERGDGVKGILLMSGASLGVISVVNDRV